MKHYTTADIAIAMKTTLYFTSSSGRFISPVLCIDSVRDNDYKSYLHRDELLSFCERYITNWGIYRSSITKLSFHLICKFLIDQYNYSPESVNYNIHLHDIKIF